MPPPSITSGDLTIRHRLCAKSSLLGVVISSAKCRVGSARSLSLRSHGSGARGSAGLLTASPTRSQERGRMSAVPSRLERRELGRELSRVLPNVKVPATFASESLSALPSHLPFLSRSFSVCARASPLVPGGGALASPPAAPSSACPGYPSLARGRGLVRRHYSPLSTSVHCHVYCPKERRRAPGSLLSELS